MSKKYLLASVALSAAALGSVSPAWSATPSPAALTWSLAQYDFGSVTPGQEGLQTFTLINTGGKSSGTISVTGGSTVFVITSNGCTGKALGAGKSCDVTVEYAPSTTTGDTTTLAATSEYSNASMNLSGNGKPNLVLSPGRLTEQWIADGVKRYNFFVDQTTLFLYNNTQFTVSNTGNGTSEVLQITSYSTTGQVPAALTSDTCTGTSLAPSGSCTFNYTPQCQGSVTVTGSLGVPYIYLYPECF